MSISPTPKLWNRLSVVTESPQTSGSLRAWCGHILGSVSGFLAGGGLCGCQLGDATHFHQMLQVGHDSILTVSCIFECGFSIVYARLTAYSMC